MTPSEAVEFYRRYIACCNEHRFDELGEFVTENVNSPDQDLGGYIAGLRDVVASFPDYHWQVEEILTDGDRLAVRLTATGTHTGVPFRGVPASGRRVETVELAMYHLRDGRISRCWGDLGTTVRDHLVSGDS